VFPGGSIDLARASLGESADGSGALHINGSTFLSNAIYVGNFGDGTIVHGGTAIVGNGVRPLYLAFQSNSTGHYTLDSGTLDMFAEYVGYQGSGTFAHEGGSNQASSLLLGAEPGASGQYELHAGQLTASSFLYVGYRGTGTFVQSGGTLDVGTLEVAARVGSLGTYHFDSGQINATEVCVGYFGDGTMIHNGGALNTSLLRVGFSAQSSGLYEFAGGSIRSNTLRIDAGRLVATPGTDVVVQTQSVFVQAASQIDLNDNTMIVEYEPTAQSPINAISALLATGYNGGSWSGPGIASSLAGQTASRALAAVESAQLLGPTGGHFKGIEVDGSAVIVLYAWNGDANLDGQVNHDDLALLSLNWQSTGALWTGGDFTYNGIVDIDDLALLAANWTGGSPFESLGLPALPMHTPPVPEPMLAAPGTLWLFARRRGRFFRQ
jgi:hypothetical protein